MPLQTSSPVLPSDTTGATDNLRGIILMALGFFVFAAADAAAKVLTQSLHPLEILWFRQSGLFTAIVIYILMRGTAVLRTRSPKLQIARGVTATFSAVFFLIGITYVPLADATSVTFIAPFMVTVLAALILRESVGIRRWTAVGVGLVGVLIVIRPGMGVFHPAIVFVLMAATAFSLRQVLSRMLSGQENIMTTVAYTSIVSFVLACIGLPFVFTMPDTPQQWLAIGIVAVLAATGEYLVIRALDIAQAVVVAPLHYTIILWSTGYGFVLFGDLPDGWTLLGCAIIVASGLYTLNRERLAARRKARD